MEKIFNVIETDSAKYQGSGDNIVLSTPRLVAYMENVAKSMIDGASVGFIMEIKHLAPTPINTTIKIICDLVETNNKKFIFNIQAYDNVEKIAEAKHVRVKINLDEFQSKCDAKINN